MTEYSIRVTCNEEYVDEKYANIKDRLNTIGNIKQDIPQGYSFWFTVQTDADESTIRTIVEETISGYDEYTII